MLLWKLWLAAVLAAVVCVSFSTPLVAAQRPQVGSDSPVRRLGRASLSMHGDVWVLNLFGTRQEMAYQHGYFARDRVRESALPFFADKIHGSIRQTYVFKEHPALGDVAARVVDRWVTRPLRDRLPAEDREVDEAFARGADVPVKTVLDAKVVPDVGQWLTTRIFGDQRVGAFGCSTVVAHDGEMVHARNLDYESYGVFDRMPAVAYFHPDDPAQQPYAGFTSLGIHTAGITGFNASGIALSLHLTYVDAVSLGGTPILAITERVVREARTLSQAIAILEGARYAGSWNIVLSSARERRAASVEVSADGTRVRMLEGPRSAVTNHVQSDLMKPKEFQASHSAALDTRERLATLERGFAVRASRAISIQDAVDLVSSGPVAAVNNIQSVVLAPDRGSAFVAVATVPGGKPMDGYYVEVPLDLSRMGDTASLERELALKGAVLAPTSRISPDAARSHARYREAARLSASEGLDDRALPLLDQVGDPLMAGLTCLKSGRGKECLGRLLVAARAEPDPYRRSLAHLFAARIYLSQGSRDLAREHQRKMVDPLARRFGREMLYFEWDFGKIVLDFAHRDVYRF